MQGYRRGFRHIWRVDPKYLQRIGVKRPGKYHEWNQHGGVMWALPCECREMTDARVGTILEKCGESNVITKANLFEIRKMLSFTFQLQGGPRNSNFPCVHDCFDAMDIDDLKPTFRSLLPKRLPSMAQLRMAFTTPWDRSKGPYLFWCQLLVAAYDAFFNGLRPNIDFAKVKADYPQYAEVRHLSDLLVGWASTLFKDGRAKLSGLRKGREWRRYVCCHCEGGTHIVVPADVEYTVQKDGSLLETPTWCTTCPLAANQFLLRTQWYTPKEHQGLYKTWGKSGRWTTRNVKDVPRLALDFLKVQGITEEFDRWCGRKVYGRLCDELEILYRESFPVQGDLPGTWNGHYQFNMPATLYTNRNQPDDPRACIQSGRKIALWLGRGKVIPPPEPDELHVMLAAICTRLDLDPLGKKEVKDEKPQAPVKRKREQLVSAWPGPKRQRFSEDGDEEF